MNYHPHLVDWDRERVSRFWAWHRGYPPVQENLFSWQCGPAIYRKARRLGIDFSGKILDFGCGSGDLIAQLRQRGIDARGIEFAPQAKAAAEARFGQDIGACVTEAKDLPTSFEDASFDAVFLIEVIEHLLDEDLGPTLGEIRRLLRPGGRVMITTPNREPIDCHLTHCPDCGCTFHPVQHVRAFSPDTMRKLLTEHGLRPIHVLETCLPTRTLGSRLTSLAYAVVGATPPHLVAVATAA
ncbi:MAG: class I SAM-dependent methyltransferase [Planctomycetota bacterium]